MNNSVEYGGLICQGYQKMMKRRWRLNDSVGRAKLDILTESFHITTSRCKFAFSATAYPIYLLSAFLYCITIENVCPTFDVSWFTVNAVLGSSAY